MARKRMIDPSIWTDEGMAALTPRQQLLYIGLFSNADDEGRLKGSAASVRLMLPTLYEGVATDETEADLAAVLHEMRQLVPYEYEGRRYLAFRNYRAWQRIDRPSPSNLPSPPEDLTNIRRAFDEGSSSLRPEEKGIEEKLEEEKQEERAAVAAAPRNGVAVPKTPRKSLAPLVDAFRAKGLPDPTFLPAEARAAGELLKHYSADDLAACWQDHASGEYSDDFSKKSLSFAYLSNYNRLGNWQAWKRSGRPPPGKAKPGGLGRQGYAAPDLKQQLLAKGLIRAEPEESNGT